MGTTDDVVGQVTPPAAPPVDESDLPGEDVVAISLGDEPNPLGEDVAISPGETQIGIDSLIEDTGDGVDPVEQKRLERQQILTDRVRCTTANSGAAAPMKQGLIACGRGSWAKQRQFLPHISRFDPFRRLGPRGSPIRSRLDFDAGDTSASCSVPVSRRMSLAHTLGTCDTRLAGPATPASAHACHPTLPPATWRWRILPEINP